MTQKSASIFPDVDGEALVQPKKAFRPPKCLQQVATEF